MKIHYNIDETGRKQFYDVPQDIALEAKCLPFDLEKYFYTDQPVIFVNLHQLLHTRLRPSGVTNAVRSMRRAYKGLIERRSPISIKHHSNDMYLVIDGNSTVAAARLADWPEIVCEFV